MNPCASPHRGESEKEISELNARGGADTIVLNDLTRTGLINHNIVMFRDVRLPGLSLPASRVVEIRDGNQHDWDETMALVETATVSSTSYEAVASRVDLENLADYMLLHIFAESEDWPQHNWYAIHRRATNGLPATPWTFLPARSDRENSGAVTTSFGACRPSSCG